MDQFEFPPLAKAAHAVAYDVMVAVLDGKSYAPQKTAEWVDTICQTTLTQLKESVSPNFKYVVTGLIVQKLGAGLHLETAALWDATTDGSVVVKYENSNLVCLTTVMGIAL